MGFIISPTPLTHVFFALRDYKVILGAVEQALAPNTWRFVWDIKSRDMEGFPSRVEVFEKPLLGRGGRGV